MVTYVSPYTTIVAALYVTRDSLYGTDINMSDQSAHCVFWCYTLLLHTCEECSRILYSICIIRLLYSHFSIVEAIESLVFSGDYTGRNLFSGADRLLGCAPLRV